MQTCLQHYASPVGRITLAGSGEALTGLWLEGQKYYAATLEREAAEAPLPVLDEARRWLDLYFAGRAPAFLPPLAPRGSPFRQAVWAALLRIPYGQVSTYGAIARSLGGGGQMARAVGGAVGHNPISILIPCHRVLGASGSLTGYAGGVEKKRYLLALEGAALHT